MGWWVADLWNDDQRMRLFSWIIWVPVSICLHELGHGVAALWEEDDTPVRTGHMTFDPMVHMGGTSLIVFALFGIAWGQMPVNPLRFRHRRMGEVIVAAAGPLVNLLLAAVALLILSIWVRYIGVETNFSRNFTIFLTTGGTLNFVLLLAWTTMKKASQLLGEYPEAVQLFTDRLCETVYDNLGKDADQIEPLLYDRWSIYSDCEFESGPDGVMQLAKSFDACCGDTIVDPDMMRTYSLDLLRRMRIASDFMAFLHSVDGIFAKKLG